MLANMPPWLQRSSKNKNMEPEEEFNKVRSLTSVSTTRSKLIDNEKPRIFRMTKRKLYKSINMQSINSSEPYRYPFPMCLSYSEGNLITCRIS